MLSDVSDSDLPEFCRHRINILLSFVKNENGTLMWRSSSEDSQVV